MKTGQLVQHTEVRLYRAWQHMFLILCWKENWLKIKFRLRHRFMSVFMDRSFANDVLNQVTVLAQHGMKFMALEEPIMAYTQ